jgi:Type III secretion needle MxiH, YscF, SsaG, EprI, PscF, EscF
MSAGPVNPQQSPHRLDIAGMQNVSQAVSTSMASIQQQLADEMSRIGGGSTMSAADMIKIQYDMSHYTMAAQTLSSIMKDISDTMKAVVQHIG